MKKHLLLLLMVAIAALSAQAATNYGINVGGVEVSSSNYNNVTGGNISGGTVKYDPTNKILTLTSVSITRSGGDNYGVHNRSVDGLTIRFTGTSNISSDKANALHLDKSTTVSITGTLNAKITAGENAGRGVIYVNDNATVWFQGGGTLNVTGRMKSGGSQSSCAIAGFEGKGKTSSSYLNIANLSVNIDVIHNGIHKFRSVSINSGDVKIRYSSNYRSIADAGALNLNNGVDCVTPGDNTSFNTTNGYFVGGSTYTHFTNNYGVIIRFVNFSDANLRAVLRTKCSSGEEYFTPAELQNLTSLDVSNKDISHLHGVDKLAYLTYFDCSNNRITELNLEKHPRLQTIKCTNNQLVYLTSEDYPTTLQALYCGSNPLKSVGVYDCTSLKTLDASNNTNMTKLTCSNCALTSLNVSGCSALAEVTLDDNQLTTLPTFPSSLKYLSCKNNKLTELYSMPISVERLYCGGNKFTSLTLTGRSSLVILDIQNTPTLTSLNCSNNILSWLYVEGCGSLTSLDCSGNRMQSLGTLPSSLKTLNCSSNALTSLPSLPSSLQELYCGNNGFSGTLSVTYRSVLKKLDVSNNTSLTTLGCNNNALTSLNVDGCTALTTLDCRYNQLTSLGTLPNSLQGIYCADNRFTSLSITGRSALKTLDVSSNTSLTTLNCYSNALTTLSLNGCTALTTLDCKSNQLTSLGAVPTSVQTLNCSRNKLSGTLNIISRSALKTLDVSYNTSLTTLNCYSNALTSLNADGCSTLTTLDCKSNQLTSLGTLPYSLQTINCSNNKLSGKQDFNMRRNIKTLDLSNNPEVTELACGGNALTSLNVSGCSAMTWLYCENNQLTSLGTLPSSLQTLICSGNKFTTLSVTGLSALKSLNVSNNTALTNLNCSNNALTSLNVSGCSALRMLSCHHNQLASLDVENLSALQSLNCNDNQLSSLSVQGTSLTGLHIEKNNINGDNMSALINSMRTIPEDNDPGNFYVFYEDDASEGNAITDQQIRLVRGKRWTPYKHQTLWVELTAASSGVRGDLNGDGEVDVTDVSILIDVVLGKPNDALKPDAVTDLDGNGMVDVSDVGIIIDIVLGKV